VKTREIYTHVSNRDLNKIKSTLDMWGGIIPIQDDMRIADIPELYAIAKLKVFKLEYLKYKEGLKWER